MTEQDAITIHYLTWLKNTLGQESEAIVLPEDIRTVDGLLDHLAMKGGRYEVFEKKHVIFADINGEIVPHHQNLAGARQIAFFSPIVGG